SCQLAAARSFGSSTSSLRVCAPRSRSLMRSGSLRKVANTCQSSARYWRVNSRPMPREAPMTRAVGMPAIRLRSGHLDRDGGGLAAADAQRRDPPLAAGLAQRAQQRHDQPCAGGADRMAERDRAAMDVDLLVRDAVFLHR